MEEARFRRRCDKNEYIQSWLDKKRNKKKNQNHENECFTPVRGTLRPSTIFLNLTSVLY